MGSLFMDDASCSRYFSSFIPPGSCSAPPITFHTSAFHAQPHPHPHYFTLSIDSHSFALSSDLPHTHT
ncbi:hypothetical protein BGZ63DRAFT_373725 [Mariannaea sp. PMI_226]|nr:hypothetical protein BGZ63DRAFT_373725 [Mariannaea sp. PMI_226]